MQQSGDQVVLALTEDDPRGNKISRFTHPIALTFHLGFRVSALITYLFCGLFSASFIASFLVVLLLASMDFWSTKNITGRLLVGLRWWNYVDDTGKSHWVFESRDAASKQEKTGPVTQPNKVESRMFWAGLLGSQVVWGFFFFTSIFTLNLRWLMVVAVCSIMNGANLYGYIRCRIGAKADMSQVAKEFIGRQVVSSMFAQTPTESDSKSQIPGSSASSKSSAVVEDNPTFSN